MMSFASFDVGYPNYRDVKSKPTNIDTVVLLADREEGGGIDITIEGYREITGKERDSQPLRAC